MEETGISDLVKQFLNDYISSVAQLETLLLLQTDSHRKWRASDIARELRTEAPGSAHQLDLLLQSGLVKGDPAGGYFYSPANDQLHAAVIALTQAYLVRRVTIISLIFTKPPDNLRAFSDAFRFRKEPPK